MIRKQRFTTGLAVVAVALMTYFYSDGRSVDGSCPRVYKTGGFGPLNFAPAFTTVEKFNDIDGIERDDLLISSPLNSTPHHRRGA